MSELQIGVRAKSRTAICKRLLKHSDSFEYHFDLSHYFSILIFKVRLNIYFKQIYTIVDNQIDLLNKVEVIINKLKNYILTTQKFMIIGTN